MVAAAGTLHSPALLLRSGVKCGGNVGKHLRLHPATFVMGSAPAGVSLSSPAPHPREAYCAMLPTLSLRDNGILSTLTVSHNQRQPLH